MSEQQGDGADEPLGAALRRARESQGASVGEAARDSGVPESAITALEASGPPTEIAGQTRLLAHLRVYGRFLGFDAEALLRGVLRAAAGGPAAGGEGGGPAAGAPAGWGSGSPPAAGPADPSGSRRRGRRVAAAVGAVVVVGLVALITALLLTGPLDGLTVGDAGGGATPTPAADGAGRR